MAWYGPSDDCGCPCERLCGCHADSNVPSRSFTGTPTAKVVVSGLPASYAWVHYRTNLDLQEYYEWDLVGLNGANGTYFIELPKRNAFCVDENGTVGFDLNSSFTENKTKTNRWFHTPCEIIFTDITANSKNLAIRMSSIGSNITFQMNASQPDFWAIKGFIEFWCVNDYDSTLTTGDNTLNAGFSGVSRTWPKASGDIKIHRRAISDIICAGDVVEGTEVFETIGTITAELLDL